MFRKSISPRDGMYSAGIQKTKINLTENRQNETWTEGHADGRTYLSLFIASLDLSITSRATSLTSEAISFAFPTL